MSADMDLGEARRRWPLVLALCLLVGTAEGLGAALDAARDPSPARPILLALGLTLGLHWAHWTAWALLFPLFHGVVRRFPLEPGRRARTVAAYAGLAPVMIGIHAALHLMIAGQFDPQPGDGEAGVSPGGAFIEEFVDFQLGHRVLGYSFALAVALGLEYHGRATEAARRASAFEAQLARAQFDALRAQLHPHFLFNTLNSISALLHRDADAADRMIARLGDFLRLTLENGAGAEVPLEDELRFARCYLGIQEVRFSDRLTTRFAVAPDVEKALVPHLILQPLVENAVRHGIQRLVGPGQIVIRAERIDGTLRLEVSDNGPGPAPAGTAGGLGLANIAARLRALYGDDHSFEAGGLPDCGFRVTIDVPYRPVGPEAACAS
jgi:two-component system, LytTR family, sensor kinase